MTADSKNIIKCISKLQNTLYEMKRELASCLRWYHFFLVRLVMSFIQKSYAHPDEYWQGLEVSHKMVFGYGLQTWEWEPENALRSPMHPYIFAIVYKVMAMLQLDNTELFIIVPKNIIQPLIATLWDVYLIKLASQLNLDKYINSILIVNFLSFAGLSYPTRMYTNTLEGIMITISLYFWCKDCDEKGYKSEIISRWFITLNFLLRSTSLIFWPLVFIYRLCTSRKSFVQNFLVNLCHARVLSLIVALAVDYSYYHKVTLTSFNFLYFNLLSQQSGFFGEEPIYFLLFKFLPEMLTGHYPFFFLGLYILAKRMERMKAVGRTGDYDNLMSGAIGMTSFLFFLHTCVHQEQRFLVGIYQLCQIVAGVGLYHAFQWSSSKSPSAGIIVRVVVLTIAVYFSIYCVRRFDVKESRTIDLSHHIRNERKDMRHLQIMGPCWLAPFHSVIHRPIELISPSCAPTDDNEYASFRKDPKNFIFQKYESTVQRIGKPDGIVVVKTFLYGQKNIREVHRFLLEEGYHIDEDFFYKCSFESMHLYIR